MSSISKYARLHTAKIHPVKRRENSKAKSLCLNSIETSKPVTDIS